MFAKHAAASRANPEDQFGARVIAF